MKRNKIIATALSLIVFTMGFIVNPVEASAGNAENKSVTYIQTDYGLKIETSVDKALKMPSFSEVKSTSKSIKTKVKKVSGAKKYQIQCATNEKFTWILGDVTTTKKAYTFKNLLENRTHYFRTRSIQTIDGKTVYSPWSKTKVVKTKDDPNTNESVEITNRVQAVIKEQINSKMSDVEKLYALHNWMAEFIDYDWSLNNYDIYSAVMEGSGICSSYSQSVSLFCQEMNIPCKRFVGTVGYNGFSAGHAWNTVQIDGKWYIYDVTLADSGYGTDNKHEKTYEFGWNIHPEKFLVPYDYTNDNGQCLRDYYHCDEAFPKPAGKSKKYHDEAVKSVKESIIHEIANYYADLGYTVIVPELQGIDWYIERTAAGTKIIEDMANTGISEFVIVTDGQWFDYLFYDNNADESFEDKYGIKNLKVKSVECSPSYCIYGNVISVEYK